ncbi:hypothetical protein ACHAPI_005212 [Fusarium lateritium]
MGRTDINNKPISCGKCKKGHRDASCNDSHPGPCFYRGTRGRPRRDRVGQVRDPIPVPGYLLRPVSGVPVGPSPGPPPLSQAVRYPHLGSDSYDAPVASPNFSSGATSPNAFHSSGQSSALVSATSSGTLSSEEAPGTPATPPEDQLNFYRSSDQELHDLQAVSCERAGLEKLKDGSSHASLPSSFGPSIGFDSEAPTVPLTWEDFEQWGKDHDDGDSYREGDLEKWCKTNFDFT